MTSTPIEALAALVEPRLRPTAAAWLKEARAECRKIEAALARRFPQAARQSGHGPLLAKPPATPRRLLGDAGPRIGTWMLGSAARVLLLLEDGKRAPVGAVARATALYFTGDGAERIAVLRALQLLPTDGDDEHEGLRAVRDALRANAVDLFGAAILDNDYASAHLSDVLFRQAVLKAVFNGLPLARIERLEERADDELLRMMAAYVSERREAGRPIPDDVTAFLALERKAG